MSLIEIYNIIFQILFIFLILSLPLFPVGTNNKIKVLDFSLIDKFSETARAKIYYMRETS